MIEKTTIEKPALKAVCSGCPAEKVIENNYAYGSPDEKFKKTMTETKV